MLLPTPEVEVVLGEKPKMYDILLNRDGVLDSQRLRIDSKIQVCLTNPVGRRQY